MTFSLKKPGYESLEAKQQRVVCHSLILLKHVNVSTTPIRTKT